MSERGDRPGRREVRWRLWQQLPLLLALILLWMLLWGEVSLLSLASGILVAAIVTAVFYLPPVELSGRFNPLWFAVFLVRFGLDVVAGSVLVASRAFAPRPVRGNAIVAVRLRTASDFIMTMTATAVSLVPGTVVIEIDRDRATLYLHVIGAHDHAGIEAARRAALATEARLVRALGSREDVAEVRR
jgi:multicomponent Na+:H+ antiporter subunit E